MHTYVCTYIVSTMMCLTQTFLVNNILVYGMEDENKTKYVWMHFSKG